MGVLDGQAVDAAVTNPAFINKNQNDSMPNILGLNNPFSLSIADIQATANKLYTATGASEINTGTQYNATPSTITNGQNYQTALGLLAGKFSPTTGHFHTGAQGDGPILSTAAISNNPNTPFPVASASVIGVSGAFAWWDHQHEGIHSLSATGQSQILGDAVLSASGATTLSQSGNVITIFSPTANGVTSLAASGQSQLQGNVVLVAGTNVNLSQTGQNITIAASTGSIAYNAPTVQTFTNTGTTTGYLFTISTLTTCAVGDTYTNNGHTYTVQGALSSANGQVLYMSGASAPTSSGTLTRSSGSGTSSITFSANVATATYTTPTSPSPLYIRVRMVGGGGGGGGSATYAANDAGAGGSGTVSAFGANLLTAKGGGGDSAGANGGGVGGSASIGVVPGIAMQGSAGEATGGVNTTSNIVGGAGAPSALGGGGAGGTLGSGGSNGGVNSGGGGGGGSGAGSVGAASYSGGGGGSGGFVDAIITSPSATYVYLVGTGGSGGVAGTSGQGGGSGAAGIVNVTEYYQ